MQQLTLAFKEPSKATEALIRAIPGVGKLVQVFPDREDDVELSTIYVIYVEAEVNDVDALIKEVALLNNIEYVQEAPRKTIKV